MIDEITDGFQELISLADRGLTKIFKEPWPPHSSIPFYGRGRGAYRRPPVQDLRVSARLQPQPSAQHGPMVTQRPARAPFVQQRAVTNTGTKKHYSAPKLFPIAVPPIASSTSGRPVHRKVQPHSHRPTPTSPRAIGIKANEISLDLDRCDLLVIAIAEMEICKEIFAGWSAQLDLADPRRKDELELNIVSAVANLNNDATAALHSSHSILRNYRALIRIMDLRLGNIARSKDGGPLYVSKEFRSLASNIASHSSVLIQHVKQIQERLRDLVRDIERTKEKSNKRALRRRIWGWFVRAFKAISVLLSAGGTVFALFHPLGFLESTAIGGASMLSAAAARLCEIAQEKYNESTFDEILVFLRDHIPESAKAAELALTSFQACHRVLQVELEVRQGKRSGWMNPHEAKNAHVPWGQAARRLRVESTSK